jgi:two-component system sensor histidine kinase BaeS
MPRPRGHWRAREGNWEMGGRGFRPPWWPDGEPWPPHPEAWRQVRRRFLRRVAGFAVVALTILALLLGAFAWFLGQALGTGWSGGLAVIVLVLAFLLVASWVLRGVRATSLPLGDLIGAAARMEAGELGGQVEVRGPRDVQALAATFNAMSARLAATEEQRRRLLADVSHELRTPLTVLQGNVEAMLDGVYPADREHLERVRDEARQLERLIDDLRTLSLADAGALALNREEADLRELAREVAAGFEAQASEQEVSLAVQADSPVELELDPQRIRQVITNLVANALRHTPSGGRVTILVAKDHAQARLEVRDTGAGMSAQDAARAFDRFWRQGEGAGAGLGLAIVRDLIAAHGGEVSMEAGPGAGTRVTCTLPA